MKPLAWSSLTISNSNPWLWRHFELIPRVISHNIGMRLKGSSACSPPKLISTIYRAIKTGLLREDMCHNISVPFETCGGWLCFQLKGNIFPSCSPLSPFTQVYHTLLQILYCKYLRVNSLCVYVKSSPIFFFFLFKYFLFLAVLGLRCCRDFL